MAEECLQILIEALRDHGLPCDRDALMVAIADPSSQTAVRDWIEEYLSPKTLLTKDEASLYATLCKTGEADALASQDLSLVQVLHDEEIQTAIEELKRSTAAIEKQTEALRLQQSAMNAMVKSEKRTAYARSHTEQGQLRKWTVEKDHVTATIEELTQSLIYQTSDLDQQSKASEAALRQTVDSILKSDDTLLLSLQKLSTDLEPGRDDEDGTVPRIRELCARLIKHTVEGIRTKLDRVYLEGLGGSEHSTGQHTNTEEINDLQEELESLYSEILPLAQMSAEQQFLEPALKAIAASEGQGQERTAKAVKYIHDCLIFLVNRIETFLERAEESQCHNTALQIVIHSAKKELQPVKIMEATIIGSPIRPNTQRRRKSSTSQSSLKVRNTRRSSGHFDEDLEPEQQLARILGVALPAETVSDSQRAELLERMLAERLARLEGHAANLQSTTESSISSHLLDAHMTLELLHDSLLADSSYHKVRLLDPDLEASVGDFEHDVHQLQEDLEAVDLHALQARNISRQQFIERWSR